MNLMNLSDYYGLGSQGLLLAALAHRLLCNKTKTAPHALPVAGLLALLVVMPWGAYGSLARWLRGVTGDPGLLLTQLAALSLLQVHLPQLAPSPQSKQRLAIGALAIGVPLNVIALGGGQSLLTAIGLPGFDPYAWGYHPQGLLLALAGVALWLYALKETRLLFMLGVCSAGYALHGLDSDNLWDYLLDPMLCGLMLFWCVGRWRRRV